MLSWMGVESCKDSCGGADPAKDTVKFNTADIMAAHHEQESQRKEMEKQEERRLELERQPREQERQERDRREHEARMRREQEEITRQAAEEAERLRQEELDRQREEEIQRKRTEELQRQRHEKSRKESEEIEAAQAQLSEWLTKNKFASVNAKKKTLMKSRYPLHEAVAQKDVTAIRLLLRFGADPTLKNSAGRTAQQLADSMKGGETASAAFMSQSRPRVGGA